jgi:cardiolipin synthase A/B
VARFLPTFSLWRFMSMNLRTHRKILVVDGRIGFTGGMNIRAGHALNDNPKHPVQDIHFRVQGPLVGQLQEVFADDWNFCTQERLTGEKWFAPPVSCGEVMARGISDGPDEDFEILRLVILGALSSAKSSIKVVTPYFLPDPSLISALNVAAMRGVEVDIVLPAKNNLPYIHWASAAHWWQVLERGCRIWLTPPPFDHSKLVVIDGCWSLIGSANWDPRSLRLNFEFNLECYDCALAARLTAVVQEKIRTAREITLREVDSRPLALKLRDGIARLATPFL